MAMRGTARLIGLALIGASLGGCVSFGPKPPSTLLNLTADAAAPIGPGQAVEPGRAVTVLSPVVPQALNVLRVPVMSGGTVAYLKDAQWIDSPSHLFRDLLAATIGVRTGRPVLDVKQYALQPGMRLTGRLDRFDYDAGAGQAMVRFTATLVRGPSRIDTRAFEAQAPTDATPANVGAALNRAANMVAAQVADWVGR